MPVLWRQLPYRCRGSSPAGTVVRLAVRICPRKAVTSSRAPAAGEQSPRAAKTSQQPLHADRVLFVGSLPGDVDADKLQEQISTACAQVGHHPTLIEVAKFVDESQRSRFTSGWKHKGYALVAFTTSAAVSAVAAAVKQVPGWGALAVLGPARKLPKHWTPEITLSPRELQTYQHQQAAATVRRRHNKRQRQRQQQRLVSSVDQILHGLPAPGGTAVLQQYKPLIGSWGWGSADKTSNNCVQHCDVQTSDSVPVDSESDQLISHPADDDDVSPDDAEDRHAVTQLVSAMPQPLRAVMIKDRLQQLLLQCQQQRQPQQLIRLAAAPSVDDVSLQLLFDWSKIPAVIDPAFGGQLADAGVVRAGRGPMNMRALRKRVQVESFALLLLQLTLPALQSGTALHIIEFGCGSGNLVLPLAHLFPGFRFTAVDMKHSAVQLLQQRVQQAQITNIRVLDGTIEEYSGDADVVLALHACGAASDWSLLQAKRCGAAFIISPCCIGKINKDNTAGLLYTKHERPATRDTIQLQERGATQIEASAVQGVEQQQTRSGQLQEQLQYPRSQWLTERMGSLVARIRQEQQQDTAVAGTCISVLPPLQQAALVAEESSVEISRGLFSLLAQAADYSHQEHHGYPELAALAKSNVEFDRARSMIESGYAVVLVRLLQPELTAKSDVLVGAPSLALDFGATRLGSARPRHGGSSGGSSTVHLRCPG